MLNRLRHASLSGLPIRSCAPSPTADFHNLPKPINSISQTFLTFHHLSNSPTLLTHLQHFWITFEKCSARFSRRLGQNIKAIRPLLNHSSPVFILLKQQITFSRERWFSNHFPALKMRSLKLALVKSEDLVFFSSTCEGPVLPGDPVQEGGHPEVPLHLGDQEARGLVQSWREPAWLLNLWTRRWDI